MHDWAILTCFGKDILQVLYANLKSENSLSDPDKKAGTIIKNFRKSHCISTKEQ